MKNLPKLFLVEDDAIFAMLMKKSLNKIEYDHELTTFKNGLEILNHIKDNLENKENLPEIILLDLNMPVMAGWQFLEELVQIHDKLPKKPDVYVLSSSIFTDDIEKTKQFEIVTDYLVKPVSKDKLNEILGEFSA